MKVLEALELAKKAHPDLRYGQLLEILRARLGLRELFFLEDSQLAKALEIFAKTDFGKDPTDAEWTTEQLAYRREVFGR